MYTFMFLCCFARSMFMYFYIRFDSWSLHPFYHFDSECYSALQMFSTISMRS